MSLLSKHPFDWIIHCLLCFIPIWQHWATWFVVVFVAVMLEYEQWRYSGQHLTWNYFYYKCLGDLIADAFGIVAGFLIR